MKTQKLNQTVNSRADSTIETPPLSGQQVLLAEDCPDQGRLYLKFLQMSGAAVTLECTGQSAVDTVRKTPTFYDAVVMDFQMPELDGLDATKQMRELGHEGAIIAISAFDSEELRSTWMEIGCNEFLKKPLGKTELISAILRHLSVKNKAI